VQTHLNQLNLKHVLAYYLMLFLNHYMAEIVRVVCYSKFSNCLIRPKLWNCGHTPLS